MALQILTHAGSPYEGAKRGATSEVGINISRFTVRYYPEVNENVVGIGGVTIWRVVSAKFSREIQCDGEILKNTGVMLWTVASALTFQNFASDFIPVGGTFYMDEATVTASRNGWLSVSIKASARATL
jgi:hypothetical protein